MLPRSSCLVETVEREYESPFRWVDPLWCELHRPADTHKKMKIDRPPLTQPGIWDCNEWTPCVPSKQSCERRCSSLKQCWAKCFLWSVNFGWLQFAQYDWNIYLFILKALDDPVVKMYHLSYERTLLWKTVTKPNPVDPSQHFLF